MQYRCDGVMWKNHRKLLNLAFRKEGLKQYISIFNDKAIDMTHKLRNSTHGSWSNIQPLLGSCTLDIALESLMGFQEDTPDEDVKDYGEIINQVCHITSYRILRPWTATDWWFIYSSRGRKTKKLVDRMQSIAEKVLTKKIEAISSKKGLELSKDNPQEIQQKKSLMDLLLTYHMRNTTFSRHDVKSEVNTFVAAGYETTLTSLSWIIYLIGLHSDVQDKIIWEMDSIFGEDNERCPSYDDLSEMKYLNCVIKEAMRLYPAVPLVFRELQEDVQVGNYLLPRGLYVAFYFYAVHRNPKLFPDPEKFCPERFLPENSKTRHPFAFLPFSSGFRNCIGQNFAMLEIKVILCHLFRNFRISSLQNRDEVNVSLEVTLKSTVPLYVRLTPRHVDASFIKDYTD